MKILHVIDTLNVGGAERVCVTLANIQSRNLLDVTVLTLLKPGPLCVQLDQAVNLVSLNRKWKFSLFTMWRFVDIARHFDIIHVHCFHNLKYVIAAQKLFIFKRMVYFHDHYGDIDLDRKISVFERFIYLNITVLAVSSKLVDWTICNTRISPERVFLLRNTIEPNTSDIYFSERNNGVEFVVISNFRRSKQIELALKVFSIIQRQTNGRLTIYGTLVDVDYYNELLVYIKEINMVNHVEFIHDCNDVQPYLVNYDLALHTPLSESGPLVLIEYMARGLPFLTKDTGEIAALIKKDFPQLVISSNAENDWIERLSDILRSDLLSLSLRLKSFFNDNFTSSKYYEECLRIYKIGQDF